MNSRARNTRRYVSDVPLQPWSHARVALFCGGILMLLYGLSRDPAWVEGSFVQGFGGSFAMWLGWITSPIPISVAEVGLVLLVAWEVYHAMTGLSEVGAGRRRWYNALLGGLLHLLDLVLLLAAWFYLSWGVAYARPAVAQRLDLPIESVLKDDETAVDILRAAALDAIDRVNEAYRDLHGVDDRGAVTEPPADMDLDAAVERGFLLYGRAAGLPESFVTLRGPVKRPFLSPVLSHLGISGVYVPFTGEATVNAGPPDWAQIEVMAHEKAHQRMSASEDEASFVGMLALVHSDEPLLRYAGWQAARRWLERELLRRDPSAQERLKGRLLPGPQRDLLAVIDYWDDYDGPLAHAETMLNDTYLKAHGVEGGVQAYARAGILTAAWAETVQGRTLIRGDRRNSRP